MYRPQASVNFLDSEREQDEFQRRMQEWREWNGKQPQSRRLPLDQYLRTSPGPQRLRAFKRGKGHGKTGAIPPGLIDWTDPVKG